MIKCLLGFHFVRYFLKIKHSSSLVSIQSILSVGHSPSFFVGHIVASLSVGLIPLSFAISHLASLVLLPISLFLFFFLIGQYTFFIDRQFRCENIYPPIINSAFPLINVARFLLAYRRISFFLYCF